MDGISLFDKIDFPYMIKLDDSSRAEELFEQLDALHLKTDTASAFLMQAALLELVSMFLLYDSSSENHELLSDSFTDTVMEYINNNITEKIQVRTLAELMGFNEKYFISVFNRHFGTTPAKYVKRVRLEMVKNELLYTKNKISCIANDTGYSGAQKLSKDFKEYTGLTPMEFRRNFK
jgi:AraC-like DNA-binding protein